MKKWIAMFLCVAMLLLTACSGNKDSGGDDVKTFKDHTKVEIFHEVPALAKMDKVKIVAQGDYGADNYLLELSGVMPADYTDYLKVLESAGFETLATNGETGIDNMVFNTIHKKGDLSLSVAYSRVKMRMYLSATEKAPVSPNLQYEASYVADNEPGAKTTLTMQQVPEYGNFYIIQLKNGHFILNDGGWKNNLRTITDYLQTLVPEGEIPVVEAWFISHEHEDHMEFLKDAVTTLDLSDRIRVEGFYLSQVNEAVKLLSGASQVGSTDIYRSYFTTSSGEMTPIYRPHMGERYYFNDITVEVLYTQEQIASTNYTENLNASSTWLMYNIEGQKFLLAGDTELQNMQYVMEAYSEEYMDVDMMNHHHHSLNIYTDDLNYYSTVETLLYSTWGTYSIYWPKDVLAQNLEIQKMGIEYLSYIDGGKRFTFPYTVGTYETLEPLYPETSERLVERQEQWLKEAGLA